MSIRCCMHLPVLDRISKCIPLLRAVKKLQSLRWMITEAQTLLVARQSPVPMVTVMLTNIHLRCIQSGLFQAMGIRMMMARLVNTWMTAAEKTLKTRRMAKTNVIRGALDVKRRKKKKPKTIVKKKRKTIVKKKRKTPTSPSTRNRQAPMILMWSKRLMYPITPASLMYPMTPKRRNSAILWWKCVGLHRLPL